MKKIAFISIVIGLFSSCSGFLDEVDKDKLIPTETAHYAAVLLNEFSNQQAVFRGVDFMTDNIDEYGYISEDNRKPWKPIYTWQMEIELSETGERIRNNIAWEEMYKDIAVANYVIESIDEAIGSQEERDFIKGEAYFVRAYSLFELANLYGQPYRKETSMTDLGIPLRLDNAIQQTYQRATVAETYKQILDDLSRAKELIVKSGLKKSKFHPSEIVCDLLLSRAYLYMEDWVKSDLHATQVISNVSSLSRMVSDSPYATATRSDILFTSQLTMSQSDLSIFEAGWRVNNELIDLYHTDDIRLDAFFQKINGKLGRVYYPKKRTSNFTSIGFSFIRVAEAYLNRAEARFHLDADAAADLRTLMESRYRNKSSITIASGDNLLTQIHTERRKEFCFEGHHRWFDLRRMHNRPLIQHVFTLTDANGNNMGTQRYSLLPEDPNYSLPIPLTERDNNPLIRNNERFDKLPER